MEKDLANIKFKYAFREYQLETLDMLEKYIYDKKLHIVAAPGAGKTILALELLRRIGKKTLILVPNIAIKEQWIERLKKDFINGDKKGLISDDLEDISIITVITYQYLYSLNRKKINLEKIIKENKIETIVLDEAHHLRNAWQKILKDLTDKLVDVSIISLTATPPYDNGNDFSNYMDLCGEIDANITVPQLVKSNCLCPHQDYIYFNVPTENQEKDIKDFYDKRDYLIEKIKNNNDFIKCIALNDYILNAEDNIKNILEEFDLYISMLSFLKEVKCCIPANNIIKNIKIPNFNNEYMQIILQKYIFGKNILEKEIFKDLFEDLKHELRLLECIDEDNKINLKYNKKISDILIKNVGKLESISEIIEIEKKALQEKLKLVVVTDYIKEEFYSIEDINEINEIGVMPIFRKIIAQNVNTKVIVLTGTKVIIPTEYEDKLYEIAENEYGISREDIDVSELGIDFNYADVSFANKYSRYIVNLITKLFERTDVSVLIGTIALIGEGWDAPFVNSLIMATIVSSYVTANQVRGRTIRKNKLDPNKVSNIWHLVCAEKYKDGYILGHDYEMLSKRFLAFEGLNFDESRIDIGIDRLNLDNIKYSKAEIININNKMESQAIDRNNVKIMWENALKFYVPMCTNKIPQEKIYKNTTDKIDRKSINFFRKLYYKNFIDKVCYATYKSLIQTKRLEMKSQYFVTIDNGNIVYGLKGASVYEQMIFLKSIKQAISLNKDSRYIVKTFHDVCSVPEFFNKNKNDATMFIKNFKSFRKKLIYTKTDYGREILLKNKLKELKRK